MLITGWKYKEVDRSGSGVEYIEVLIWLNGMDKAFDLIS